MTAIVRQPPTPFTVTLSPQEDGRTGQFLKAMVNEASNAKVTYTYTDYVLEFTATGYTLTEFYDGPNPGVIIPLAAAFQQVAVEVQMVGQPSIPAAWATTGPVVLGQHMAAMGAASAEIVNHDDRPAPAPAGLAVVR